MQIAVLHSIVFARLMKGCFQDLFNALAGRPTLLDHVYRCVVAWVAPKLGRASFSPLSMRPVQVAHASARWNPYRNVGSSRQAGVAIDQ